MHRLSGLMSVGCGQGPQALLFACPRFVSLLPSPSPAFVFWLRTAQGKIQLPPLGPLGSSPLAGPFLEGAHLCCRNGIVSGGLPTCDFSLGGELLLPPFDIRQMV